MDAARRKSYQPLIFFLISLTLLLHSTHPQKTIAKRYICDNADDSSWDNVEYNYCNDDDTCCSSTSCNSCVSSCKTQCETSLCESECVDNCNNCCKTDSCQIQECSSCIAQCGNTCSDQNCMNQCSNQCDCDPDNNNDINNCCVVLHPKHCFVEKNTKKRCVVRRHRECSRICRAQIVAIRYNSEVSNTCYYVQSQPFVYCGHYELIGCQDYKDCLENIAVGSVLKKRNNQHFSPGF